ncbi:hypothetical protein J2S44_000221 [Catenuloplanes niger]|uniref:Uncharacterized protein n=1 Tax=Catenuloplanes niger TaxID=587534 RepID=A0AAE3ZJR2_9ACTN|nr:hypothetical protein [Catenuloplanes niger]
MVFTLLRFLGSARVANEYLVPKGDSWSEARPP